MILFINITLHQAWNQSVLTDTTMYSTPRQNIVSLSNSLLLFCLHFFLCCVGIGGRQGGGKGEARGEKGGRKGKYKREKNKTISIHLGQKFTHRERGFLPTLLQRILSWWD